MVKGLDLREAGQRMRAVWAAMTGRVSASGKKRGTTGYYVAKKGRLTTKLHSAAGNASARSLLESQGPALRNIARHLERNYGQVTSILTARLNAIVGATGPTLQVRTTNQALDETVEKAWKAWGKTVTPDGDSWRALVRMVAREVDLVGESFVVTTRSREGLELEVVEPEQLATWLASGSAPGQRTGTFVQGGIEYDRGTGRPVAYYVRRDVEFDQLGEVERVDAARVIHVFEKTRASQVRGVSVLAAVAAQLFDVGEINAADLTACKAASYVGYMLKIAEDGGTASEAITDLEGETVSNGDGTTSQEVELTMGEAMAVPAGYDMEEVMSNRPSANFAEFRDWLTGEISAATGVPKEHVTGDYSGVNFSSSRMSARRVEPAYVSRRKVLEEQLLARVFDRWLEAEVLTGRLPVAALGVLEGALWMWPGFAYHDPVKEMQADVLAIQSGFKTWAQVLAERGLDYVEQLRAMVREREMAAEMGVALPGMVGGVQMTGNQQGSGSQMDAPEDAEEMMGEEEDDDEEVEDGDDAMEDEG